ncbi:MAG: 50S ribosomal protein L9 [Shewanella sp.]
MQIILLDNIHRLGHLGDVVNVKNGFARNYLIPQGMARRATKEAIAEFELRRAELEKASAAKLAAAKALCEKINGSSVTISQKAGVDGRLFGSVTNHDITAALHAQGYTDVVKAQIQMPEGPLKVIGEHEIAVALHAEAVATLNVIIVPEADR